MQRDEALCDIVEQSPMAQQLRLSPAQLSLVLEGSKDGFFDWDVGSGQVQFSPGWASMFGYDLDELEPGVSTRERLGHPEDRAAAMVHVQRHLRGETDSFESEERVRHRDGRWLWALVRSKAVERDATGLPVRVAGIYSDITERKRTEEALSRANGQLASVLESAGHLIAMMDTEYRYTRFNGAFHDEVQRRFGVDLKPGDSMLEAWAGLPEELAKGLGYYKRALAGEDVTVTEELGSPSLGRAWYVLQFCPIRDPGGQVVGAAQISRNITERQQMGEALRESEEQHRRLVDAVPGVLYTYSEGLGGVYYSPQVEGLLGYSADHLQRHPMLWHDSIHPDDLPAVAHQIGNGSRHGCFEVEYRIRDARGQWRVVLDRSVSVATGTKGQTLIQGLAVDITERKELEYSQRESEARFRAMADSAPVLIWLLGLDKGCTWFNAPWLEFTGRTQEQERGGGWAQGVHPDDLPRCLDTYVSSFDRRESFTMEYRLRRHDGEYRWLLDSGVVRRDEAGHFAGYVGSCIDITDRKELERELEGLNASLEERVRQSIAEVRFRDQLLIAQSRQAALGEMIGNIAHQWRQPLNALGLTLINLRDASRFGELDDPTVEATVRDANRLIAKMSTTISDFSNFLRPVREKHVFSALAQARVAVAMVEASYRQAGISVEIEAEGEVRLLGFPNEYSQVILNLLGNAKEAIVALRVASGRVTLRLEEREGLGCLSVRDNGGGIPEAVFARLFEPYFSTKEGGTGIGLSMSLQIVEQSLGGRLEARNVDGGAEFTVLVPLARGEVHAAAGR